MKTGIATALIALVMPVCVFATTLRLSTDIDLLVLDGKRSPALLRGADSIELDNGPHQLVFRVEKSIGLANHEQRMYISPPLIVSFNTRQISQVNITLPRLETEKESAAFDASPRIELLDGDAMPIPVKLDILALTTSPKGRITRPRRRPITKPVNALASAVCHHDGGRQYAAYPASLNWTLFLPSPRP
jgi:uncharacterized protein YccT (UPF0319 family)